MPPPFLQPRKPPNLPLVRSQICAFLCSCCLFSSVSRRPGVQSLSSVGNSPHAYSSGLSGDLPIHQHRRLLRPLLFLQCFSLASGQRHGFSGACLAAHWLLPDVPCSVPVIALLRGSVPDRTCSLWRTLETCYDSFHHIPTSARRFGRARARWCLLFLAVSASEIHRRGIATMNHGRCAHARGDAPWFPGTCVSLVGGLRW
ncbi:hypothetical protein BU23DRAFT_142727 [Bimuria novae-zelandiae CBS 107.79]|uniref:Uncharacterized protein n=1 Tax=Bimuria novae-zelandiae CBS 107.79 TaxID=1447943 RepID=A0A6A5VAQ9_9PLEO|nr:hypothetical protein BU23DRAFT_142727 [Bimuria novae-zelandiae CBS 107.79]